MLSDEARERVEKATVRLLEKGGQGIVVPTGLILTAAHCITWRIEGAMALGDHFLEEVECGGRKIRASVLAIEPVSDIAVLGPPDDQMSDADADTYEAALGLVDPVEINTEDFELFRDIPAAVYTHNRTWIGATVRQCNKSAWRLSMHTTQQIESGTSGGPIVDHLGRLLGVVSDASESDGRHPSHGMTPRPHLALPVWTVRRIQLQTL